LGIDFSRLGAESVDLLDLVLVGVPLPILVGCIVWFVRFNNSQQKGERLTIKWRDMDPVKKTVTSLIVAWIFLNLYLAVVDMLAFLNVAVLPFSWIYSLARPTPTLAVATTTVGLAVVFRLRFPRRPVVA
jgi:hypothetical protein